MKNCNIFITNFKIGIFKDLHKAGLITQKQLEQAIQQLLKVL